MATKFVLKRLGRQFMFNLKAPNNKIILTSEWYKTKSGAENGIKAIKTNSSDSARYDRRQSRKGEPYFVLKAANGEPIGRSEMYSSSRARENGIQSVARNAPVAIVEDLTSDSSVQSEKLEFSSTRKSRKDLPRSRKTKTQYYQLDFCG